MPVAVLRARMADGALPRAVVLPDVRHVQMDDVPGKFDGIVAGCPCIDFSRAGAQRGADGEHGALLWEVLRLADASNCWFIFLENVDNVRFHRGAWRMLLTLLDARDFHTRWVSLPCESVGAPQKRVRWFALAVRGAHPSSSFADALGEPGVFAGSPRAGSVGAPGLQSACLTAFRDESGRRFNAPGQPPVHRWMLPRSDYGGTTRERLKMLGNAVVPLQAVLAASLLAS